MGIIWGVWGIPVLKFYKCSFENLLHDSSSLNTNKTSFSSWIGQTLADAIFLQQPVCMEGQGDWE